MSDIDVTGTLLPAMIMAGIAVWLVVPPTASTRIKDRKPPPLGWPLALVPQHRRCGCWQGWLRLARFSWGAVAASSDGRVIRACGSGGVVGVWST
ncbi:hypothetical protein [Cutibacterium modestum]|uniref:hypothetical protein n=1 Tax=Cutibacterium modestum TaxID=2559073 RepID=UPI001F217786|nr:hypothetical protein [Cutibacterium modestum]